MALCVLPNLPVPSSALLVGAGAVLIPKFGYFSAFGLVYLALAIAMFWGYWASKLVLSRRVEDFASRRFPKLLSFRDRSSFEFAMVVRGVPGCPLFIQTGLLGATGVPFLTYVVVTLVFQFLGILLWMSGADLVGTVLAGRMPWLPLLGISLAVGLLFLLKKVIQRIEQGRALSEEDPAERAPVG